MTDFFEPAGRGVQHASLRAANRRAVLTTIALNPGISNADVSRRTGLAPQTASAIVAELEGDGLIGRGDVLRGRRGQPATPLFLDFDGAYSIGCEISWRHVEVRLIDLGSREIGHYRRDYPWPDANSIVDEVADAVAELVQRLEPARRARLAGLGLASPSHIERNIGALGAPPLQEALWRDLDLAVALERATGFSTSWFNDGNAACWAEMVMSAPPRPSNFVYLFVSTFLGAGVAAEHTLWQGPTGNSANLGAMLVAGPDGARRFGHGVASTTALLARLAEAGIAVPRGNPVDWPVADWEAQVGPWLAEAGAALAEIVLNTAAVIEVDRAVIDGVLPPALMTRLVAATAQALDTLPSTTGGRPQLVAGRLGSAAVSLGAAQLPMFRRYFSRRLSDMLTDD